jgi:hypothetical protein
MMEQGSGDSLSPLDYKNQRGGNQKREGKILEKERRVVTEREADKSEKKKKH